MSTRAGSSICIVSSGRLGNSGDVLEQSAREEDVDLSQEASYLHRRLQDPQDT